jgi:hypothetical protein
MHKIPRENGSLLSIPEVLRFGPKIEIKIFRRHLFMRKLLGASLLVIITVFIQACAPGHNSQDSCGFIQNAYGERMSWKNEAPVTMYLHESVPDEYVPALLSAVSTWEKSAGRKLFNIVTTPRVSGPNQTAHDGRSVIYFSDTWNASESSQQAITSVLSIGDQIVEADMRINATGRFQFYWKDEDPTKVNIEALFLHELGHVLGLKHREGDGSVMAANLKDGEDRIALGSVDNSDLKCEY